MRMLIEVMTTVMQSLECRMKCTVLPLKSLTDIYSLLSMRDNGDGREWDAALSLASLHELMH